VIYDRFASVDVLFRSTCYRDIIPESTITARPHVIVTWRNSIPFFGMFANGQRRGDSKYSHPIQFDPSILCLCISIKKIYNNTLIAALLLAGLEYIGMSLKCWIHPMSKTKKQIAIENISFLWIDFLNKYSMKLVCH
jgi:hypothetical protein